MYELAGGEIIVWAENGGPIMLKVLEKHGDPVELAEHEAEELVSCLQELIAAIREGGGVGAGAKSEQ